MKFNFDDQVANIPFSTVKGSCEISKKEKKKKQFSKAREKGNFVRSVLFLCTTTHFFILLFDVIVRHKSPPYHSCQLTAVCFTHEL